MPQEFIGDVRGLKVWIPACTGMTGYRFHYGRVQITACAGKTGFQVAVFDFLFCGNNGILDDVHFREN
ncbi:TPA: hypothetical protein ACLM9N_000098 [Neisseria meningitidis]